MKVSALFLENLCTPDFYCEIMYIKIIVVIIFAYVENKWVYEE